MKIALVWPKSTFLIDPMVYPPLGLWYVWGALKAAGHSVDYFDLDEDALPLDGYASYWVSGTTPQVDQLRKIGTLLRREGLHCVLGGPHAFLQGEEMTPYYNTVVKGEVFTANRVGPVFNARGFYDIGKYKDLSQIGLPVRDAAPRYKARLRSRLCTTMMTSLGCPYHCAFCSSHDLWGKVRYVPMEVVKHDIFQIRMMGYKAVQFYDDILPIRPQRALAIADLLSQQGLIWRCFMRSDLGVRHGKEFLQDLADRGLVEMLVGVESSSQRIKDNVNKGTTVEQDTVLREWCREVGISYKASIILGLPGETRETMEETRAWLLENKPDRVDVNVLIPMPGTPLYDNGQEYDCHWTEANPGEKFFKGKPGELECLVETEELSSGEILDFRNALVAELAIPY